MLNIYSKGNSKWCRIEYLICYNRNYKIIMVPQFVKCSDAFCNTLLVLRYTVVYTLKP